MAGRSCSSWRWTRMTTGTSSGEADGPRRRSAPSSRPPVRDRSAASSSTSSIEAGRVGRPHGLDGSFHVTGPETELLAGQFTVAGVTRDVTRRAGTDAAPILRLEGIDTREAVEALRGEPLLVDRSA